MERAVKRVEKIRQGDPYEMSTQIGAQASNDQYEKILSYFDIGKKEGAKVLTGGVANKLPGDLAGGYYIKPTVFEGHNKMRVFQEEIFGPVVSVTTFDTPEQALEIANDTLYGLGRRRLDARYQYRLPVRARHQGGTRVDQLLSRLPGACRLRRLQEIRHRPRDAQDDARPLSADQERAGELRHQGAGLLLMDARAASASRMRRAS